MSKQIRYVVVGLAIVGAVAAGTYLGWSALSGGETGSESTAETSIDESWEQSEAEAEAPEEQSDDRTVGESEDRTDGESEKSKKPDDSKASDESEERTAESSEESETSEESEESKKSAERTGESSEKSDRKVAQAEKNDETATVPTTVEHVDETADQVAANKPGQQGAQRQERKEYEPAVLQIVTNFKKADVTVNGLPYPEYKSNDDSEEDGMVLPAGGPYKVEVTYDGKKKYYTISLRPYEVRVLMVELSGFKGGKPSAPQAASTSASNDTPNAKPKKNDDSDAQKGRVTVYSKPKGTIQVDGEAHDQKTPGTVEVSPGQHDIQVEFDDGKMSESKTVRVRKGSRIKLFFRKKD